MDNSINPKAVNRYKDRHVLSKAKSDTLDALSLGNILRTDRHLFRPLKPLPVATLGPNSKDGHQRFQAAEEIAKLSGCVPVVRESGKWRKVSLRYACVKSLRRTFHDWAFTRINCSPWVRAFYDYHKERETKAIVLFCETSVKNGPKYFLLYGHRELLTMKHRIFKTSKQEMSLGLWLCNP